MAQVLNNLGQLAHERREHTRAVELLQKALAVYEKTVSPNDPDLAACLHNLAASYASRRAFAQAEPLFRRALQGWERSLGPDHPQVATALAAYSHLLRQTGRKKEARELAARAASIRAKEGDETLSVLRIDVRDPRSGATTLRNPDR